jgi:hypothetical protein
MTFSDERIKEKFQVVKYPEHYAVYMTDEYGNVTEDFGIYNTKREANHWAETFLDCYLAEGF